MELTKAQQYHLILGDIAMAMSIKTLDVHYQIEADGYLPGALRDRWLAGGADKELIRRVTALANAGLASLTRMDAEVLLDKANRFGVPLDATVAGDIVEHYQNKRDAVLVYNR